MLSHKLFPIPVKLEQRLRTAVRAARAIEGRIGLRIHIRDTDPGFELFPVRTYQEIKQAPIPKRALAELVQDLRFDCACTIVFSDNRRFLVFGHHETWHSMRVWGRPSFTIHDDGQVSTRALHTSGIPMILAVREHPVMLAIQLP